MKIVSFLFIIIALVFTGCATSPNITEVVKDPEPIVVAEVEKEAVKIVSIVYYPVKVESYFGDGVKDEYTIFNYNGGGSLLLEEGLFSADDSLQQSIKYEYKRPESTVKSHYNFSGNLISYEINTMDTDGNLLKREKFDNKDVLQSMSEYEYVNGMMSIWKVFGESGGLLSTTVYSYSDNLLSHIESLSPGGELEEYFELNYDANGLLLENIHKNADGKILDSRSFEYKNGYLVLEIIKRKNGSVLRKILYENDKYGNPVETVFMDAGDNVQERLVTVFESREEISYEK